MKTILFAAFITLLSVTGFSQTHLYGSGVLGYSQHKELSGGIEVAANNENFPIYPSFVADVYTAKTSTDNWTHASVGLQLNVKLNPFDSYNNRLIPYVNFRREFTGEQARVAYWNSAVGTKYQVDISKGRGYGFLGFGPLVDFQNVTNKTDFGHNTVLTKFETRVKLAVSFTFLL